VAYAISIPKKKDLVESDIELVGLCKWDTQRMVIRVAKHGPAVHVLANRDPPRPLALEPHEARLDLSHLSTTHHAVPSTASSLSH
jgi:hypothetical protein